LCCFYVFEASGEEICCAQRVPNWSHEEPVNALCVLHRASRLMRSYSEQLKRRAGVEARRAPSRVYFLELTPYLSVISRRRGGHGPRGPSRDLAVFDLIVSRTMCRVYSRTAVAAANGAHSLPAAYYTLSCYRVLCYVPSYQRDYPRTKEPKERLHGRPCSEMT